MRSSSVSYQLALVDVLLVRPIAFCTAPLYWRPLGSSRIPQRPFERGFARISRHRGPNWNMMTEAVVKRDGINVGVDRGQIAGADVENPLLSGRIPPEASPSANNRMVGAHDLAAGTTRNFQEPESEICIAVNRDHQT
jgi:hypothetical protein